MRHSRNVKAVFLIHALAVTILAASAWSGVAFADTAMRDTNPGYYHFDVGDYRVTALSDGTLELPAARILHTSPERVRAALEEWYLDSPVETSVNAYLIDTGDRQVLVDAGGGDFFGSSLDRLLTNLRAAGYSSEQIDAVCLTHMHTDHLGGLLNDGERTFPNAALHVASEEAGYWLDRETMQKAPESKKGYFERARAAVKLYADADALQRFDGATELFPGIHARPAHGHTPGHTIYRVDSAGETLILWGDLIHVAAVQFERPGVAIDFDSAPKQAIESRRKAFEQAAKKGLMVAGAHLPFPGVGHIRSNDDAGYDWYPSHYSPQ